MDPLSISTAALSFLAVAGACAKTLTSIILTAKHTPNEILALANEIADLNIIINDIDRLHSSDIAAQACGASSLDFQLALSTQLNLAKNYAIRLQQLVNEVFVKVNGQDHFSRQKWVRKKSQAASLKFDLLEVKRNLNLLLSSATASRTLRIELSLQKLVTCHSRGSSTQSQNVLLTQSTTSVVGSGSQTQAVAASPFQQLQHGTVTAAGHSTLLQQVRQIGNFAVLTFHIHRLAKCGGNCTCICHSRVHRHSPTMFNNLLGSLFVGYAGLPVSAWDCSIADCSNQYSRIMQVSYTFPSWFLAKTVEFVAALTFRNEPSFGLKVRHRVRRESKGDIFHLARQGDTAGIIELFRQRKASPSDVTDVAGETPLHFALELGHIETCKFLLDMGVDPFTKNDYNGSDAREISSLVLASKAPTPIPRTSHDFESVFHHFATDHSELWDFTHLHSIVVDETRADLATAIRSHRQELDARDIDGRTPLYWAALRGDHAKLEILLQAGASVKLLDRGGDPPFHAAIMSGSKRCVELLLLAGADVHTKDNGGHGTLQIATWSIDDPELLRTLLMAGAKVDALDVNGCTALTSAACLNNYKNGAFLIEAGADINRSDRDGDTPLLEAVRYSSVQMLELLLSKGANAGHGNKKGQTILHLAARLGDVDCINSLARFDLKDLDPHAVDDDGATARLCLEQRGSKTAELEAALETLIGTAERRWELSFDTDDDTDAFVDAFEHLNLASSITRG